MDVIELLSAALRGDSRPVVHITGSDAELFRREARRHGVLPLVADRLAARPGVSPTLIEQLQADAQGFVAADLGREVELRRVLGRLAAAEVNVLVLKGAALAYTHYSRPDLRPRDDTDLLVAPGARSAAGEWLTRLGYRRREYVAGDFVSYQATYEIERGGIPIHTVDLHWRVANPQLFAGVLEFEELWEAAVPIPAIGPGARGLAPPHALLLACVHRVAHHRDDDLLVWLYDIHLIASRLAPAEWSTFLDLAHRRGVMTICRQGLDRAASHFGTVMPAAVRAELGPTGGHAMETSTSAFLHRDRAQLTTLVSDLRALPTWGDRRRLLSEHLFPPASYMRQVYAPASRAPLALLYGWRALRGAWRWVARG